MVYRTARIAANLLLSIFTRREIIGLENVPWFQGFPGGAVPGFVPGATEFDVQPFLLDLGLGSLQAPLISVPEPLTMTLLGMGALAILRRTKP